MDTTNSFTPNKSKDRPVLLALCLLFSISLHILIVFFLPTEKLTKESLTAQRQKPTIVRLVDKPAPVEKKNMNWINIRRNRPRSHHRRVLVWLSRTNASKKRRPLKVPMFAINQLNQLPDSPNQHHKRSIDSSINNQQRRQPLRSQNSDRPIKRGNYRLKATPTAAVGTVDPAIAGDTEPDQQ